MSDYHEVHVIPQDSAVRARAAFARNGCPSCGVRAPYPLAIRLARHESVTSGLVRMASIRQDWRESASLCGWCERRERNLRLEQS
jgi:hypothetical protein